MDRASSRLLGMQFLRPIRFSSSKPPLFPDCLIATRLIREFRVIGRNKDYVLFVYREKDPAGNFKP